MNPRLIARRLRVLYDALDLVAEKEAREHPEKVSCRDGCHGCCYQMVGLTMPEGLLLAKVTLERDDWEARAVRMRNSCPPLLETTTRKAYFRKAIPCAYLDGGRCSAYAARPSACRFHYVLTPPEDCHPSAGVKDTLALNMIAFERYVWELNIEAMGSAAACAAPLQLTTLWCLWLMADGERKERLERLKAGLPDPHAWTLRAFDGGMPDVAGKAGEDERRAIVKVMRETHR